MPEFDSIEKCDNKIEIKNDQRKIKKSVPFIVMNIFFERYCTAGILGANNFSRHLKV